jgi:methylmalonyl-CoA/ethylmalonyl-CoA epimerase
VQHLASSSGGRPGRALVTMPNEAVMLNSHLVFHHLGLAVRCPDDAIAFVSALGYQIGETVFDPGQNVNLIMCTHVIQPAVEIIWPGDSKGPVHGLMERHPAGVIYHVCYATDDLRAALAGLEKVGLRAVCVSPPKRARLFGGRKVSFYSVAGIGLMEILE